MSSAPSTPRVRVALRPIEAKTEGVRLLRVILQRQTFGAVARRVGVDDSAVRAWALEIRRPLSVARWRAEEVLSIPFDAWDEGIKLQ
jgi:hypothetical protein